MKNRNWTFVKTVLITYLVIAKMLFWIDTASGMMQGDMSGAWNAILMRFIGWDFPLLLAVIGFVAIHKLKGRLWVKLALGYLATNAILFLYIFIMVAIGMISVMSYFNLFIYYTVSYIIINSVLILKDYLKQKGQVEQVSFSSKAKKQTKTILCFGDSNTFGYDSSDKGKRIAKRWTRLLQQKLGSGFYVVEEGLNGRTISSVDNQPDKFGTVGKDYLVPCVNSHLPIDLIVVMLGTNELKFSKTAPQIGKALENDIIDTLVNHDYPCGTKPKILIMSPAKVNSSLTSGAYKNSADEASFQLDAVYREIAERKNIEFLSVIDFAVGVDGVHLTEESHAELATLIYRKVKTVLN